MKASELIAKLAEAISEKGDLEVKFEDSTGFRFDTSWVDVEKERTPKQDNEIVIT